MSTRLSSGDLILQYGPLGVVAAAIALVTAVLPTGGSSGRAPAAAKTADPAGKDAKDERDERGRKWPRTHAEFLARVGVMPAATPPWPPPWPAGPPGRAAAADPGTDFLVVCVPDPAGTQFAFWFDQAVESVSRAMVEADRLTLDRYWYPPVAGAGRARVNGWEDEPGVVVYRGLGDSTRRRLVLLVGESPVGGPHPDALAAALDLAATGGRPVRVLGPFFSGSQRSLGVQLARRAAAGVTFDILSGSTHALNPIYKPAGIKFESTRVPASVAINLALRYLRDPSGASWYGKDPAGADDKEPDYALLIESNSGYGMAVINQRQTDKERADLSQSAGLVLRFPMNVSELIRMASKEQRARDERLGLAPPAGSGFAALGADRGGGDDLPAQDPGLTALINQRVLSDYWAALNREKVRYAGVVATDPRDKVFLIEQMRRACPHVQPFVVGTEAMHAHPEYLSAMRGVVIAGDYPLNPTATEWTRAGPPGLRLPFPSGHAQGVYNAALLLCADDATGPFGDPAREATPGRLPGLLRDYGPVRPARPVRSGEPPQPDRPLRPTAWVTAVGNNGRFAPLAYSDDYVAPVIRSLGRPAGPAQLALVGGAPAGVTHSLGGGSEGRLARQPGRPDGEPALYTPARSDAFRYMLAAVGLAALFGAWQFHEDRPRAPRLAPAGLDAVAGAYAAAGLGLTLLPFAVIIWWRFTSDGRVHESGLWDWWQGGFNDWVDLAAAAFAGSAAAVCLAAVAIRSAGALVGRAGFLRGAGSVDHVMVTVAGWTAVVGAWLLAVEWVGSGQPRDWRPLFLERAGGVTSGFSVVTPALLMGSGLFWVGVFLRWIADGWPAGAGRPYPLEPASKPREWAETTRRLVTAAGAVADDRLLGFSARWVTRVPVLAAACVLICAALLAARPTPDGPGWDAAFAAAGAALAGTAVLLAAAMVGRWRDLDQLLKAVAGLPLSTVFAHLPVRFKRQLSGSLFARRLGPEKRDTPHQLLAKVYPDPQQAPDRLRAALSEPDGPAFPPPWLFEASSHLLGRLLDGPWKDRIPATEPEVAPADPPKREPKDPAWAEAAERFVAVAVAIHAGRHLARVRYLLYAAAVAAVGLLVAAGAYNFQPESRVMAVAALTVGVVLLAGVYVLYRLNTNEIVSYATGTEPGKFNLNATFLLNAGLVAVPLLGTAAVQLSGRARSLVEPVLDAVR